MDTSINHQNAIQSAALASLNLSHFGERRKNALWDDIYPQFKNLSTLLVKSRNNAPQGTDNFTSVIGGFL